MTEIPPAPVRYPRRGSLVTFLARLAGKEWDTFTGSWVRAGWPAQRVALTRCGPWPPVDPPGITTTCTLCGQSISLHDPMRTWIANRTYCPTIGA